MRDAVDFDIYEITSILRSLYPIEIHYGSMQSVWGLALNDGIVTYSEYKYARNTSKVIWNYCGD